ncbi:MAG: hypothetical protein ACPL8I_11085, partial [Chloroflexaceae bacterium]
MSERQEYTDEEWATLIGAPIAVIAAVIGASPSGPIGISQEVAAAVRVFEDAAENRRSNPLIAAMLVTLRDRFNAYIGKSADDPAVEQIDIFALGRDPARAVAACREAGELLARKAPPDTTAEVRAWLIDLSHQVARAAIEGGFMGMGGERVNQRERAILAELAASLGADA